ncbi:succinylglutamate desuccinylase/aspartoacylase domain-containing protein [Mesonia aquimarina]|uniref:succinylglutamate desuccinylase/aspartoacylase domain-containing protein n=1 Tax=Mesonia aquimarina TaxID=1504967 RepID=UPI000EF5E7B8|nr:succinylglutamate desuccinylase/aspartoacylase family protein [Mesonia aquimarina]
MNTQLNKQIPRIIGTYDSKKKGPLLLITAGVHGNEPSGVQALLNVFKELNKTKPVIKGTILGLAGNKKALNKNKRYIDEDLNRTWTIENLEKKKIESHEEKEMYEIINVLDEFPEEEYTKRYFIDCHTTSSDSLPYMSVQDVNDNNKWAHNFPTYIVKGFSDIITGDIDHYLSRSGFTGFVFEAGEHTSKHAIENHEGMIWLALEKACRLNLKDISIYPACVENFASINAPNQKTFEISYRKGILPEDKFEMQPGYQNFQEIKKGELLAILNGKEIKSKWNARIFMPLYQKQGDDGFFIIEEVKN